MIRVVVALCSMIIPLSAPAAARGQRAADIPVYPRRAAERDHSLSVRVWLEGADVYRRGTGARVSFRVEEDAYVVVARIDADGDLQVLYPSHPTDDGYVRGGQTYDIPGYGSYTFRVHEYTGLGYVFALAAQQPFALRRISSGGYWSYRPAGGRVHGDPHEAFRDFADEVLYDPRAPYSLDYATYHVNRRVDYPRFLCYDCHTYRPYHSWNPYAYHCSRFRIVIHLDPFYYPYRSHSGRRVVYLRVPQRFRQYEFKEVRDGERVTRENFIERRRRGDDEGRRSATSGDDSREARSISEPPYDAERARRYPEQESVRREEPADRTGAPDGREYSAPSSRTAEPRRRDSGERYREAPRRAESRRSEPERTPQSIRIPSRQSAPSGRSARPANPAPSNVGTRRRSP
ncbi:MAG: DUF4384 domain-containing protein [Gemmatimonadaceae bacterium]